MRLPQLNFRLGPSLYIAIFGGLQVALLWLVRDRFGILIPLLGTALLALIPALLRPSGRWRLKAIALGFFIVLTTAGPVLVSIQTRAQMGITLEQDGLVQTEAAIDRVLHGEAIYGVDWSNTDLALYPPTPEGPNPALKHFAYLPLQVIIGLPFKAITQAAGLGFDYRVVLLFFLVVALGAIVDLPVGAASRFMLATGLFLDPLLARFLWAGHNDVCWIAMLLCGLALLGRRRPVAASLSFGLAIAFKPFAVLTVPFLLLALWLQWEKRPLQHRRQLALSIASLLAPAVLTITPFLLANPRGFIDDTILYTSGGLHDAYFITGYGFSALLLGLGLIKHRSDYFPFLPFQAVGAGLALWFGARRFLTVPSLSRWMSGYVLVLFAFLFFSRFLNDSYLGMILALASTIPALVGERAVFSSEREAAPPLAA